MARTAGLKTELIFNLTILLSAALLFVGLLLLKLTESELLRERTERSVDILQTVARQLEPALGDENLLKLIQISYAWKERQRKMRKKESITTLSF